MTSLDLLFLVSGLTLVVALVFGRLRLTAPLLVVLYGPQAALGGWLEREWGLQVIFAPPGIVLLTPPFQRQLRAPDAVVNVRQLERDQPQADPPRS